MRCEETYLARGFMRPARCRKPAGHEDEHTAWLGGHFWIDWDREAPSPTGGEPQGGLYECIECGAQERAQRPTCPACGSKLPPVLVLIDRDWDTPSGD